MPSLYQRKVGGGEPSVSVHRSTALLPMVAEVGTWATGLEGGTAGERGVGAGSARQGSRRGGTGCSKGTGRRCRRPSPGRLSPRDGGDEGELSQGDKKRVLGRQSHARDERGGGLGGGRTLDDEVHLRLGDLAAGPHHLADVLPRVLPRHRAEVDGGGRELDPVLVRLYGGRGDGAGNRLRRTDRRTAPGQGGVPGDVPVSSPP